MFTRIRQKRSISCHWVTFGGVIKSEINGHLCRLRIKLDVHKPLLRGMGHGFKDCLGLTPAEKKNRDDPPYSLALKVELNLIGKESVKFNAL
ncbi:hypothetical protein Goklo_027816 [Gossypium klotzschianum]|uniref:Uncharacterized protein n=1 Tax=Gossypium klotzschianum TaxID=34286 RepID=A0A7J8TZS7_9ROSI|nr:hypothetical protein [Gossypium klotzschianum]